MKESKNEKQIMKICKTLGDARSEVERLIKWHAEDVEYRDGMKKAQDEYGLALSKVEDLLFELLMEVDKK